MFPDSPDIGFVQWMIIGVPFSAIMLPLTWLMMTRVLYHFKDLHFDGAREEIENRLSALGTMSRGEKIVLVVWIMTALSWIFLTDIKLGAVTIPGWTTLLHNAGMLEDPSMIRNSTVAIFFAIVLFAIPVDLKKKEFALDWAWAIKIPWGVLILFGGGLAPGRKHSDRRDWFNGPVTN